MSFKLLPPTNPRACLECAREHAKTAPHDAASLHYKYHFYFEQGRWPTWRDALAHCSPEIQQVWTVELVERGIDIDSDNTSPKE